MHKFSLGESAAIYILFLRHRSQEIVLSLNDSLHRGLFFNRLIRFASSSNTVNDRSNATKILKRLVWREKEEGRLFLFFYLRSNP